MQNIHWGIFSEWNYVFHVRQRRTLFHYVNHATLCTTTERDLYAYVYTKLYINCELRSRKQINYKISCQNCAKQTLVCGLVKIRILLTKAERNMRGKQKKFYEARGGACIHTCETDIACTYFQCGRKYITFISGFNNPQVVLNIKNTIMQMRHYTI